MISLLYDVYAFYNYYMTLEYAIYALFSVKFDVFSFSILISEIISGMKNKGFYHANHSQNLIGHVSSENKLLHTYRSMNGN